MKAIRLVKDSASSSTTVTLTSLPLPTLLPNQVLVKIRASAIHPSDVLNSKGAFPTTTFPRVAGRDFSGTIVDGPENLIGTDVYGTSGFSHAFTTDGFQAEYAVIDQDCVARKPKNLSFAQAACIGVPFTTAALTLRRASVKEGETVLVLGAKGAVGSAVVQLAKGKKCRVLGASRNDSEDINTVKDPSLEGLNALTQGKGVDAVVDTVGQPALMAAVVKKLAKRGRISFIAAPRTGSTEFDIDMKDLYREEKSILGCNSLLYSMKEMTEQMAALTEEFEKGVLVGAKEGEWTEVKLDDAVEVYGKAAAGTKQKFVFVLE